MKIANILTLTVENMPVLDFDFIKDIPSVWEAVRISIRLSKKPEKHFYGELGIDKAHWSRIMNEQAHIPMDKLVHFMQFCGNQVLLHWLAYHLGYEVRIMSKTLEDKLEKIWLEKQELQQKLNHMYEFLEVLGEKKERG